MAVARREISAGPVEHRKPIQGLVTRSTLEALCPLGKCYKLAERFIRTLHPQEIGT